MYVLRNDKDQFCKIKSKIKRHTDLTCLNCLNDNLQLQNYIFSLPLLGTSQHSAYFLIAECDTCGYTMHFSIGKLFKKLSTQQFLTIYCERLDD